MMAKTGLLVCLAGVFCAASAAGLDGNRTVLVSCRLRHEKGEDEIDIEVHPTWAPIGAARFLELVRAGFYDDTRIFRAVPDFVAQWGISGDPAVSREWRGKPVKDERKTTKTASNKQYTLAFASSGRNSRNTQVFVNLKDNVGLDQGFQPFGAVVGGQQHFQTINFSHGQRPMQARLLIRGNAYADTAFQGLSSFKSCHVASPNTHDADASAAAGSDKQDADASTASHESED
ncbi:Peptidyl-prolyl cis-trans isomerase A [Diplonema papillatum]|nr:Peptidyl-prolyl cis-trans isomerase A [Diplonema papillatum]